MCVCVCVCVHTLILFEICCIDKDYATSLQFYETAFHRATRGSKLNIFDLLVNTSLSGLYCIRSVPRSHCPGLGVSVFISLFLCFGVKIKAFFNKNKSHVADVTSDSPKAIF